MHETGTATVPAAPGKREASRVRHRPLRSLFMGRLLLTLPRPGEKRKDTCVTAPGFDRNVDVQGVTVAPIAVVRRQFPVPIMGLMETPAVERRPFPVTRVVQMEISSHA